MASIPPVCDFGWKAAEFNLTATDDHTCSLADIRGDNGTLLMFICNHCPYVLSVLDRIKRDAVALQDLGIGLAAICSNDPISHPDDGFEQMREMALREGFSFPYLHDETQAVAHAYGASCTPDFFGFNVDDELQYRGRLDNSGKSAQPGAQRDLFNAMKQVSETGSGPSEQFPSMGCSIKWKAA